MNLSPSLGAGGVSRLTVLLQDGERVLCRGWRDNGDGDGSAVLAVLFASERPAPAFIDQLAHEYAVKDELDARSTARPLELVREHGRTMLLLEDPGAGPLAGLLGRPMEMERFLRVAIGLSAALRQLHERGLIHKDIKPANALVDSATGQVWLTGFGIAARLLRERQSPEPPELVAGTLAYMAPEQTGRMNRSIDSRSDLYSLGVTLYEMLTGSLPFVASNPMDWVHSHIARLPIPPAERVPNIPGPVSAIIMKLLAKTAEERYQTAAGLERDLRRCLGEWGTQHRIDEFPLGEQDFPDRLMIPEKLYGRECEVDALLAAFDRVVTQGRPELVLVSGYSGVGKPSLVNELHKALVPPRGLFAAGKFDQYKRGIPYATLALAFDMLVRQILVKSEAEVCPWRDAIAEAVGPNGQLIINLVPEVEFLIGKQPSAPDLPPQDAQRRFQLVFRRFLSAFARSEHPLALFLDDLQWLDEATLDLMGDLLTQPDVKHLLLIGAYRDNEVHSSHPLVRKLEEIRKAGAAVQELFLKPLTREHLKQLTVDALYCEPNRADPLAQLIHDKTAGNPFFTIQFIASLADEGLLAFDHAEGRWAWDLIRINAKDYTDSVVDLLVGKLVRLPTETQDALKQLACLGNSADFTTLAMIFEGSIEQPESQIWEAVLGGLVLRSEHSYRFLHDRVQEAAYSLIPQQLRADAHLRIGRLLVERTPSNELEERIFEIVNQFNRATDLVTNEERRRVAELNLIAARRAKISTAYSSALSYLEIGRSLLTEESWKTDYELIFSLEHVTAECEMLTADMESAEKRLSMLATRADGTHYLALVTCLQLTLYLALNFLDRAIEIGLESLRRGGTSWSAHPTSDEVQREYDRIWSLPGNVKMRDLLNQPMVTRPDILDVLEVLTQIVTPAIFFDKDLCALAVCRMVNLSLEHGNSDASCFAYVWFGIVVGPRFGCYEEAFRFGQLGYDLLEKRGLKRYEARTSMCFSVVAPRTKHAHQSRGLVRHALDIACRAGDFTYAAYSFTQLVTNYLVVGDPLTKAQEEAEKGVAYAKSARVGRVVDIVRSDLQLIRSLRGLTQKLGSFNDNEFDEAEFERHLESPDLADCGFGYWTLKAQAQFFAQDYASAVDASLRAQQLLWSSPAVLEQSALRFYGALSHAALCVSASPDERQKHFEALTAHHKQLELWAKYCPDNFENRAALIGAEIARIEDRVLEAEALYQKAIRSAHANSFVHNEGVANEVAAQFYSARGFEKIANAYLHDARDCYQQWGADGKVRRFDEIYPHLSKTEVVLGAGRMIGEPVEQLDLGTVIKVSQAISVEMDLETLIDTVMRAALEHAGAVRGLLILSRDGTLRIEAEATTIGDKVLVRREEAAQSAVPQSIVNYVMRTQEFVILDDASNQSLFIADRYFSQHCSRSVLCLPLITKGKLVGLLYLENHLAPNVFISNRIAVLKLVASQAAISLENTRLYTDLKQSEAKNRRLVDANILGVVIWNAEGAILASNDAFLRMMEYDHEDVAAGRVRWKDMTPANRRDRVEFELATVRRTGTAQPFESELFRKDGSRLPVLLAGALFEEGGNEGVGFALDLSEQKRVEEAFRRSESYLAQAQRLAHIGSWVLEVPSRSALYISVEWYRIYGFDPKDGMPTWEQLFQRVHPDDRSRWQVTIDRAIAEKSDFDVECRILPPGSPIKYIHSVGQPVRSSSGELLEFIGVAMDVTDRKRSEEALRSSEAYLMEAQTLTHTGSCAMEGTSREILYWSEEMFRLFGFDPHPGF